MVSKLVTYSVNVASLPEHIEDLKILLKEIPSDIFYIHGTRLYTSIDINAVSTPAIDTIL